MIEDEDGISRRPMSEAEESMEGSIKTYTIQTGNRVKLPDDWVDDLGLEEGSEIILHHDGDSIKILENSVDNIQGLK